VLIYINEALKYEQFCGLDLKFALVNSLGNAVSPTYDGTDIIIQDQRVSNSDDSYDVTFASGAGLELPDESITINGTPFITKPSVKDQDILLIDQYDNPLEPEELVGNTIKVDANVIPPEEWVRPEDWLAMPLVEDTDDTFVGLHAVLPNGNNFPSFVFTTDIGDYQVDWGDGTVDVVASGVQAQHQYDFNDVSLNGTLTSEGYKQAIITVTPVSGQLKSADFQVRYSATPTISLNYTTGFLDCILSMPNADVGNSIIFGGGNLLHRFLQRFTVKSIGAATSLFQMFRECKSLEDVSLSNTSNVTDMRNMFLACASLQIPPLFDTSNVTDMTNMFNGCFGMLTIPLYDTSSVTIMRQMFLSCFSLITIPLINTSNVTDMYRTFEDCRSLVTIPLLDTSSVTNMYQLFQAAYSLREVPLLDTSSVTDMNSTFTGCRSLKTIPPLNTSNVTNMDYFVQSCHSLLSLPLLDTSNVTSMYRAFYACYALGTFPLLDTSSVLNMREIFAYSHTLKTIPLLDTSSATNMYGMFFNCTGIQEVPALDTTSATSQGNQFLYCNSLAHTDIICRKSVRFDNCLLSKDELVNIFNNLIDLTALPAQNIRISGCWGASALTTTDRDIALNKNWTITG
jgi:surface protein